MSRIISAFPGVGKTYLKENYSMMIEDLTSDCPGDCIKSVKSKIGRVEIIIVPSTADIRHALITECLHFTLVYPHIHLKDEYLERYAGSGKDKAFINHMDKYWQFLVTQLEGQRHCEHRVLYSQEYLDSICVLGHKSMSDVLHESIIDYTPE